jgi:menaquinone-specific isochorismate synthase
MFPEGTPIRTTTVRLRHDIDPVALGARSSLFWARQGFAAAGIGLALRIPFTRPEGATQAQAWLAALTSRDDIHQPGTGPFAFTVLPFDRTEPGELIVPEIVIGTSSDGTKWMTVAHHADAEPDLEVAIERAVTVRQWKSNAAQPTMMTVTSVHPPEYWRDQVVAEGVRRINAGEVRKVVLARELTITADHPFNTVDVIERLRQSFSAAILFSVDGFIGASPELLVSRLGEIVRAHPLAGTAPRSSDPVVDQRLAAELHTSAKNRHEHRITIDWLLDTLLPFCSYVDAEPEPSIVTLANVHHLGTLVEGVLSNPAPSVLELVAALHPTPAVAGDPQGVAIDMIHEIEGMDRGRYAGATGWVDGAGNGAFAVNVRVAQISGATANVYAGCGIVGDSDPAAELAETRTKFQAILGALIRP